MRAAGSAGKALALLLAELSSRLQDQKRSKTAHDNAANAVSHLLQALKPTPESTISNTGKKCARLRPDRSRNAKTPCIHQMLDIVTKMSSSTRPIDVRTTLALLMLLLSSRRLSDVTRVWRHPRSMEFKMRTLDVDKWAKEHRTTAAEKLLDLGHIDRLPEPDEFIQWSFRAFKPKTSGPRNRICASWATLTENRFEPRLCPMRAVADHLHQTSELNLDNKLRCDKATTVTSITDEGGLNPVVASPLFVALNGSPRTGLQPNALGGFVNRVLLQPLGLDNTPHVTRAVSSSFKKCCGLSLAQVLAVGDWTSEATFFKHHHRTSTPRVNPARLTNIMLHDWLLSRAHQMTKMKLPPLDEKNTKAPDTTNDEALAQALSSQARSRNSRSRRR